MLIHRLRYLVWEKLNPDKPWMCPGTIRFCERHFKGAARALEYGSGRSTRWFATLASQLTSVEHSAEWHQKVERRLRSEGVTNVEYLHVPLDHPETEGERAEYDPTPAYVAVADRFPGQSLDFVIVDGHYRTHCIRRASPKIRTGGYLLVDDVNMWPSIESMSVPPGWRVVDDSTNGIKRCLIWQAP